MPPSPAKMAYDLVADLQERRTAARATFGKAARITVIENVFLFVGAPPMTKREFDRALSITKRAAAAYFNNRFRTRPSRAVEIYLFASKRSYNKYCQKQYGGCGTPYGVYYNNDRRIVMNAGPGLGTLTHELVHPIVETDFPQAPEWINEGIASLFEAPRFRGKGHITGGKNWRYPRLLRAMQSRKERKLARLDRLFGMSDATFRGANEDLHYSLARYVCQWLDSQGKLWPFYQRWRDNVSSDPTGIKAFQFVMGKTPIKAQPDFARWVRRL